MAETAYTAKDITVLEGLEPVRLRPGMYIGSTGPRGLHHLVYEVVDNAVDEALAGHNDSVEVTIHPDNSVTVIDRGRGIPVDLIEEQGLSAMTVVLTKLHAGGKFGGDGYKVSGGLHGVGLSVVNALSERLVAEVRRDGEIYRQEFERGVPLADMEVVGKAEKGDSGTKIHFLPDGEIFEEIDFSITDPRPAPARDGVPDPRPPDRAHRRARGRGPARVLRRGRNPGLRRLRERREGSGPQAHRLLRGRERARPRRGRDAVEHLVRRLGLLVRQQHQHARGRHASPGLPLGPDAHAEQVRARQGPAEGEGGQPRGRGRARGAGGGHLGQARRTRSSRARRRRSSGTRRSPVSSRRRSTRSWPSSWRRTRRTRARSS